MFWSSFEFEKIPDQTGKVIIVTGANVGLGKVTSLELARKGAHVIMACRSREKSEPVVEQIKKETKNSNVEFMELDLSSLASIKAFADNFKAKNLPLHVLINNAGVMYCPFALTADGLETQFGVNHVGHVYLTMLLLPILEHNQPSRIVQLSSMAHTMPYSVGIQFEHINEKQYYSDTLAYGQSKLCNMLFANELSKRLEGKNIYVNSVHPGYVATELQRHVNNWGALFEFFGKVAYTLFARSPENGALTQLYVATSPDIEEKNYRGQYFVPTAKIGSKSAYGRNEELGKKLWDFTNEILKEKLGEAYQPPV